MHRIYFDTNEGTHDHGYELRLSKSLEDLQCMGTQLREGVRVIIYMPEELEMEADLTFDDQIQCWLATPDNATMKYLDGTTK